MSQIIAEPTPKIAAFASVQRSMATAYKLVADLLLPTRCAFCDQDLPTSSPTGITSLGKLSTAIEHNSPFDEILLCPDCRRLFVSPDWRWCVRCGSTQTPHYPSQSHCFHCQNVSLSFKAVVPLGRYRDELREAILGMKHRCFDHLSTAMARLYIQHRRGGLLAAQPDVVVAVPMHWRRKIIRGTNSAEIIALEIARFLQIPAACGLLERKRNTMPQKDLRPAERFGNVRGAFRLAAGYDIQGARVLLVDDIMTSGATCRETARVLKKGGAKSVTVAILARAEGYRQRRRS